MRDLRSFTGINSTQNIFAVSPGAEFVLFKKSSKELYYFDPELTDNNISLILIVSDHLHLDDTIFDLFFQNEQLVILLQNPEDGKISIGLCFIDLETHSVVVTEIKTIELQTKNKGGFSKLITDELGAIFISFPSTFENDNPKLREIEIFHLSDYLETGFNRTKKLCIEQRKLKNKAELWCDPFISRGALYFFNQFDHQLLVISALEEFQPRILQTRGIGNGPIPSRNFVHRNCIIFEEFAFIFFSQLMENGKKIIGESDCQAWKLYLNSMEWEPIDLFLSAHIPKSKVTMRCASSNSERIFIHGSCNISDCLEQFHLYELNLGCSTRFLDGIQYADVYTEKSVDKPSLKKSPSILQYVNVAARELFSKNKNSNTNTKTKNKYQKNFRCRSNSQKNDLPLSTIKNNRLSTHSLHSCMTTSSGASSTCSGMSWNRQMAFDPSIGGQPKLIEQLCLAKEMGFSENEIIAALEMNNTNSKSKCYNPFNDTSEMIDKLTLVQKHKNAPETTDHPPRYLNDSNDQRLRYIDRYRRSDDSDSSSSSCTSNNHGNCAENNNTSLKFPPHWTSTTLTPRTTSVNRSASFTNALGYTSGYSSALRRPKSYLSTLSTSTTGLNNNSTNNTSIHRLIETFNNERKALFEEFGKDLADMKEKLSRYSMEKRIAEEKLSEILEENSKIKHQLKDRDSLERKLTELCSEHEELKIMIERKDEIIDEQHHKLEEMNDINERYEIIQEKLSKTDDDLKKCRCENAAMEREILRLKNPEKTIKEMENEIIQLRQENREYREKQSTLVCTTCMDHPRNVLYMPCLHFICCSNCAYNSDTCSICRTRIMGKVEVYQ